MEAHSVSEAVKITKNLLGTMRLPASEMMKENGKILITVIENLDKIYQAVVEAEKASETPEPEQMIFEEVKE